MEPSRMCSTPASRQDAFADWLVSKDNPYFARIVREPRLELLLRPGNH